MLSIKDFWALSGALVVVDCVFIEDLAPIGGVVYVACTYEQCESTGL